MGATLRYALADRRWQIIGWGLAMFVLGALLVARYDMMASAKEQFKALLDSPIGKMVEAMGGDKDTIFTPEGFLNLQVFSFLPLVLGVFVIMGGSGLLAADEEKGTLDLILAHPVSRSAQFGGRLLAFLIAMVGIVGLSWLGLVMASAGSTLEVTGGELLLPYLSFLAVLLLFGMLALFLSMVLPSRRSAALTAGLVLVASFFLTMIARSDKDMQAYARLLPMHYFQAGKALHGLDMASFGGLLAVAALLAGLAWWRFERRDIRVSGEGSWRLAFWRRRAASAGSPAAAR
jgi:ABC-2 type transport system permease protein